MSLKELKNRQGFKLSHNDKEYNVAIIYHNSKVNRENLESGIRNELDLLNRSIEVNVCALLRCGSQSSFGTRFYIRGKMFDFTDRIRVILKEYKVRIPGAIKSKGKPVYIRVSDKTDIDTSQVVSCIERVFLDSKHNKAIEVLNLTAAKYIIGLHFTNDDIDMVKFEELNSIKYGSIYEDESKKEDDSNNINLVPVVINDKEVRTLESSINSKIKGYADSSKDLIPLIYNIVRNMDSILSKVVVKDSELVTEIKGYKDLLKGVELATKENVEKDVVIVSNGNLKDTKPINVNNFIDLVVDKVHELTKNNKDNKGRNISIRSAARLVLNEMHIDGTELNKLMKEFLVINNDLYKDGVIKDTTITTWCARRSMGGYN